ncbi:MAG: RdgB/HAM1 family non-canonical purine NTP pyrophosphatase [Acidobacteriia bacterium]|nr:RdgB/HAM1 family non-canonical purine NTP pyrophosphatase [Terriglobia bacterium]
MAPVRLLLASSNPGKLREYRELAAGSPLEIDLIPNFRELPAFDESAPTFAENGAGKALHYSRFVEEMVIADDSGLVVPALGGAPGVRSARYAGPDATDADCVRKLLREMDGKAGDERRARFVCVIALARRGRALAVVSDLAEGILATEPRGANGFGYDPIFCFSDGGRTYAEASPEEKNCLSHRGKAFRKVRDLLLSSNFSTPS